MKGRDQKIFLEALDELEKEKGILKEELLETIETALLAAYKKNYGEKDNVKVTINRNSGDVKVYSQRLIVENVENPEEEISLEDAISMKKRAKLGDILDFEINAESFKRNAIQNAKQIVVQKVRECEKRNIFNKFKEIVKSQKPAFKATFKNAKEHLKNIKFPTLEDLKPEQALGEIPFPFKETQDPVEQLKIGMCAKRRNEIRLRYRLPYLYQIMLYNFEMKAENGGVEISYGEGWDNLSCRKYCKYVNDYEMKFDLAEYYGQNLGGVELKYYNDDAIYAWFDGNDVLDKAFDELIELDYEAVCSSDEEFIEYLKRKRDTVLKHVESVEKEAEKYIKNNLHLAEELYEEKQRELKKMRF